MSFGSDRLESYRLSLFSMGSPDASKTSQTVYQVKHGMLSEYLCQ